MFSTHLTHSQRVFCTTCDNSFQSFSSFIACIVSQWRSFKVIGEQFKNLWTSGERTQPEVALPLWIALPGHMTLKWSCWSVGRSKISQKAVHLFLFCWYPRGEASGFLFDDNKASDLKSTQRYKGRANNSKIITDSCCSQSSENYCFPPLSTELSADWRLEIVYFPPAVCEQINPTAIKLKLDSFHQQQMINLWHEHPKASQRHRTTWKLSPQERQRQPATSFSNARLTFSKVFPGNSNKSYN